jgi:excisionase family DNA binding protein
LTIKTTLKPFQIAPNAQEASVMTTTITQSRYLSRAQAATFMGVCERTLDLLVANDGLPKIQLGRRVLFDPQDLDTFLAARKQTNRQVSTGATVLVAA